MNTTSSKVKTNNYSFLYFGVIMWIRMHMAIFINVFVMNFKF